MMVEAFARINGFPQLEQWQVDAVNLPLAAGGCGMRRLRQICETAYIGAWCQTAPHVASVTGARADPGAAGVPPEIQRAARQLWEEQRVDVQESLRSTWGELATRGCEKAQKALTSVANTQRVADFRASLDTVLRGVLDSGSALADDEGRASPGTSDWLVASPRTLAFVMPDAAYCTSLRARLRLDLAHVSATCVYRTHTTHRTCGAELTRNADHAHGCCRAPVLARHHAIRDLWCRLCREAGCSADTEQIVYELGRRRPRQQVNPDAVEPAARIDGENGGEDVVADVRALQGPAAPAVYTDVVVTHPVNCHHGAWTATARGVAARREERKKYADYTPNPGGRPVCFVPLAFETFGRWGPAAVTELRRLARLRMDADRASPLEPAAAFRSVLTRWRQQVAVALQRGNFEVYAASTRPSAPAAAQVHAQAHPGVQELWEHAVG